MKYTCTFEKLETNHNKMRTDVVEGVCDKMPTLNDQFVMYAEGLVAGVRRVNTSPIKSIERDGWCFTVKTESGSKYRITLARNASDGHDRLATSSIH